MSLLNFTWFPPDTVTGITSLELGSDPYLVTDVRDLSGLPSEPATSRGPFQPGETLLDNRVSGRRFSVFIEILADSEAEYWDRRDELSHAFSVVPRFDQRTAETGLLRLTRTGKDDIELECVPVNAPQFNNISPLFFTAEIQLFAPSPWWQSITDMIEFFESSGGIAIPEGIVAVSGGVLQTTNDYTFTGPADRTYFDSDGILQTAAANEARTTYIGGNPYLWIDGAVTEASGYSADLTSWNTVTTASVAKDAVGLTGSANEAFTVTDNSNSVRQTRAKNYTIADDSKTRYGIFRVAKEDPASTHPLLRIEFTGGTTPLAQSVVLDRSDGSTTAVDSDGAEVIVQDVGDFWHVVLSLTNNSSGNTVAALPISPAYNGNGTATEDTSSQGSIVVATAEFYLDNFSFHPISTTGGTTKSLAAEVASLTNSIISSLTEGTIYMEVWSPSVLHSGQQRFAAEISDGTLNNRIYAQRGTSGSDSGVTITGGVVQADLSGGTVLAGTLKKIALTFAENDFALYTDGAQKDTDAAGSIPSLSTLSIGNRGGGAGSFLYGGIAETVIHVQEWSQSEGETNTT